MISFLTSDELCDLYKFIRSDLCYKYDMKIDIEETKIVTGLAGSDEIKEALIIRFIPSEAKVEWIEDKIVSDVHRHLYENEMLSKVNRIPVLERDVWLGEIRYGIVYTEI